MRIQAKPEGAESREPVGVAARTGAILLTLNLFAFASAIATAQTPGQEAPPSSAPDTAPPPAPGAPDAFKNWMQRGFSNMGAGFGAIVGAVGGQADRAAKDAADAARDAAASVSKLPKTGITGGHERCVIAPNGAPDCRIAAETICRAKGYASGTSIDFVSVENCPPQYRRSRREAPEGVCTMEHFVTKALCQ